ncbi:MAG: DUF447 domain-containing protein [Promethearchaeota archaeon]
MSSNFQVDLTSLGLKMNYLYEVLATTYSIKNNKLVPNTAAMGIRLLENNTIKIWPFPNTTTYKNLDSTKLIILNFVDDIFLYAIASLKDNYISNNIQLDNSIYLPYLNQAWAIISCVATNKNQSIKRDGLGQVELAEISLSVIFYEKFKESFKLYNRAENLTLETIILATKLYVAEKKKDKTLFNKIKHKRKQLNMLRTMLVS